jgi:outer membrane protein W
LDKRFQTLLFSFFLTLITASSVKASNLAIRLGLWHLTKPDFATDSSFTQNRQKNFFYSEATLENQLNRFLSLDISLGTLFRGTIRYQSASGSRFAGSANVLPVSLGLTFYPIPVPTGIQPYLRGGGTVAIGNSNSGNVTGIDVSGNPILDSKTRVTAGFFGAAGLKRRIVSKVNLLAEFGYHQLRFSGPVAGISNHSGYKILAGVSINYK